MALGPGKYDDLCTYVWTQSHAEGALVIILNGDHGQGFSCQASPMLLRRLPGILRDMAAQIDKDLVP